MRKKFCAALLTSILILVSSCTTKPQQPTNSGAIAPTNTSINTVATSSTTISSSTSSLPTATIKPSTTIKNFSLEEGFSKLKSIRYATINEKTSAKKDNNTLVATRTTNVDLDNNYYYAQAVIIKVHYNMLIILFIINYQTHQVLNVILKQMIYLEL